MIRDTPPLRLALAALAAALAFWAISQLTVAAWLAHEATRREADWTQGISPWHWDFSRAASVVRPGSHGIASARRHGGGMALTLPGEGVANLSLALDGGHIALDAVDRARIDLTTDAPLRLFLLPAPGSGQGLAPSGRHLSWAEADVDAGTHRLELPLAALPQSTSPALQLRIESTPGATLHLRGLTLAATPCDTASPCPVRRERAPAFATPERLLAFRDAAARRAPAVTIEAGGFFGDAGHWLGTRLHGVSDLVSRFAGLALLALVLLALARRLLRRTATSRRRAALELAIPLGGAFVLLLAGWPARDTPMQAGIALALCLAALALLPPPSRQWRWQGDAAAWKSALVFTVLAAVATAPLALLEHEPTPPRDALHLLRYPLWALVQQWLLIAAIAPRVRLLLPDARAAALACGVLFALMHAPNFALMLFTLIGGSLWAWLGQRHRALLPLAASHAALGLWLAHLAPPWLLRSAEIGGRYLMLP